MRATDIDALGELAAEAAAGTTDLARDTHAAIARRAFDAIGPGAAPVRRVHDGIAGGVYAGVRTGLRAAAIGGSRAWARRAERRGDGQPLDATMPGAVALGALNGIWGDLLDERGSALAYGLSLRTAAGVPIAPTAQALAAAHPAATTRVAVFLHGLCETEHAWRGLPPRGTAPRPAPFGDRLRDDLDITPVYVRFNSGRRISANGAALSALLDELLAAWPTPVDELILIGHSLGGLVARSACHHGDRDGAPWTAAVRHVFCLGSPHLGADLEKGVHLLDWGLAQFPETRAFAGALRRRSVGVKDLRFGAVAETDWDGHDPDEFLRDRCLETPFLAGAHYYFVGAQLRGPLGRLFGDLLVRPPSASGVGKARSLPFPVEHGATLDGLTHFDLLSHPEVYALLRGWIERAGFAAVATQELARH